MPSAPGPPGPRRQPPGHGSGHGSSPGEAETSGEDTATVPVGETASQDDVDSADTLATIGLVVGVLGLAVAVFALVRSRRSSGTGSSNGSGTTTEAPTPAGTSSS